jgi:large subunit ribosomal protein LP2
MKHLAAYLLLGLGGNSSPSAKDIKAVLDSVGIEADDDRLNKLISELKGKDINEVRTYPGLSISNVYQHMTNGIL